MSPKKIGTHNGTFHADEVLGCFLVKQLPEYREAAIVRTRDPEVLSSCDIVLDVGGVFNHQMRRYDHHQKNFSETMRSLTKVTEDIKLSSAGLIWAHYGHEILKGMTKEELTNFELTAVYSRVYTLAIKEIDARDNGINQVDVPVRYRVHSDLASRIARMNRNAFTPELDEEIQFKKAMDMAGNEFTLLVKHIIKIWLPVRDIVIDALDNRHSVDPSGRIIKLKQGGIQWGSHLAELEYEKRINPSILYVLFPDTNVGWRVQGVSLDGGFDLRRPVLPHCLALRDEELVAESGIEDAYFVHATGFIGGARTYEGALKMAQVSMEYDISEASNKLWEDSD